MFSIIALISNLDESLGYVQPSLSQKMLTDNFIKQAYLVFSEALGDGGEVRYKILQNNKNVVWDLSWTVERHLHTTTRLEKRLSILDQIAQTPFHL